MNDPRDPRDPELSARLRGVLSSERAPARWVADALALAPHPAPAPAPRPDRRWLLDLLPQVAGMTLVLGFAATLLLRPEVLPDLILPSVSWIPPVHPGLAAPLLASVPAMLLLMVEGSRGFPHLKRWFA